MFSINDGRTMRSIVSNEWVMRSIMNYSNKWIMRSIMIDSVYIIDDKLYHWYVYIVYEYVMTQLE